MDLILCPSHHRRRRRPLGVLGVHRINAGMGRRRLGLLDLEKTWTEDH